MMDIIKNISTVLIAIKQLRLKYYKDYRPIRDKSTITTVILQIRLSLKKSLLQANIP